MKSTKFDYLAEEVQSELRKPDYDSAFSKFLQIDSKVHEISKAYDLPSKNIYSTIDVDPEKLFKECTNDADASDFHSSDVMRDLQILEEYLVPKEHRKYGGLKEFLKEDHGLTFWGINLSIGKKPTTDVGEPVKKQEVVYKPKMGYIDQFLGWVGKHPKLSAGGLIAVFVGGIAVNEYGNNKKFANYVDESIAKAQSGIFGASSIALFDSPAYTLGPTPVQTIGVNGSAVKEKPVRNDLYFILGTSDDATTTQLMNNTGEYLNKSQGIPQNNIDILNSGKFTYYGFSEDLKSDGLKASANDTIIIELSSDGNNGYFAFSKKDVKFNATDSRTMDIHSYKEIADLINGSIKENTSKVLLIDACYSYSAMKALKEKNISNIAVITSLDANGTISGGGPMISGVHNKFIKLKDFNGDGKITFKDVLLSYQEGEKEMSSASYITIPYIDDPENITEKWILEK